MWYETLSTQSPWLCQWGLPLAIALVAAVTDLRSRRIPNAITVPACLLGLAWGFWVGGLPGLADSGAASVMLAAPFVLLFLFAGGGAGDAKLMFALGAWLGVRNGLVVLPTVLVVGGIVAVVIAATRGQLRQVGQNLKVMMWSWMASTAAGMQRTQLRDVSRPSMAERIPYGLGIFLGLVVAGGLRWL